MGEPKIGLSGLLSTIKLSTIIRVSFVTLIVVALIVPIVAIDWQIKSDLSRQATLSFTQQQLLLSRFDYSDSVVLSNPHLLSDQGGSLRPLVLSFSDTNAEEVKNTLSFLAKFGCLTTFKQALEKHRGPVELCVAVGNSAHDIVTKRIFVAGTFFATRLVARRYRNDDASDVERKSSTSFYGSHRFYLELKAGSYQRAWTLPVQLYFDKDQNKFIDRLTLSAYRLDKNGNLERPNGSSDEKISADFDGAWIVEGDCIVEGESQETCLREHSFSIAIPRNKWGQHNKSYKASEVEIQLKIKKPAPTEREAVVFDSSDASISRKEPYAILRAIQDTLKPGQAFTIERQDSAAAGKKLLVKLVGSTKYEVLDVRGYGGIQPSDPFTNSFLSPLARTITTASRPLASNEKRLEADGSIYTIRFDGALVSPSAEVLSGVAYIMGFAMAMLGALAMTWLAIEYLVIARIKRLTLKAFEVSMAARHGKNLSAYDFSAVSGSDELGVLGAGIRNLLERISEEVKLQRRRAESVQKNLMSIGHEINSPLQSLSAILSSGDEAFKHVRRMRRAFNAIYGQENPLFGIDSIKVVIETINISAFMYQVVENAKHCKIDGIELVTGDEEFFVAGDEDCLESAIQHVLNNANQYRTPRSTIRVFLNKTEDGVVVDISNDGPTIPSDMLESIFYYGKRGNDDGNETNIGQGLYVAGAYLAKMGGNIRAQNTNAGVSFTIELLGRPSPHK